MIEAVGITVTKLPNKTEYFVGEKLDQTGIQVSLKYSDNSTEPLAAGYSLAQYDPDKVGKQQIRVQYMNFVAYFEVTVKERPADLALESISVKAPDKTEYFVGDKLDETGMVVTATYSDGSSRAVSGYEVDFDSSKAGKATVTVSYTEDGVTKTAAFEVTVKEKPAEVTLESITVTAPTKTEYAIGDELDLVGVVVTAKYSDGTEKVLAAEDYVVSAFDSSTAGEKQVTVSYTEDGVTKTAAFTVTVKESSGSSEDPGTSEDPGSSEDPGGSEGPGTGSSGSESGGTESGTGSGTENNNNAQTGDGMTVPIILLSLLVAASAGIAVVLGKKRSWDKQDAEIQTFY